MALSIAQRKELNKLLEDQKALEEELKDLTEEQLGNHEEYKKLLKDIEALELKAKQTAQERLDIRKEDIEALKTIATLTGGIAEQNDVVREQLEAQVQFSQDKMVELARELDALHAKGELDGEDEENRKAAIEDKAKQLQQLAQEIKQDKKLLDLAKQQREAHEGLAQGVADTVSGLTGSINASQTFAGKFMLAAKEAGSIGGAMKLVKEGIVTALSPANVMAGLFAKIQEASLAAFISMDDFRSELAKSGASLEQYGGLMNDVRDANVEAGVSMKDAQQSVLALHSGMADFNTMTKAEQKTLTSTTAIMSKLGVDAQTSAGNLNILTKAMGMNAKEADNATREIAATAKALGVSQQKMAADFASAAPQLSAYGSEGVKVFRELSTQAKATGIEMSTLLGITSQFDTFEGAAEAAGKLNAVLGTQINSIDLLTATDSERIKMLRSSLDATGKSWKSMNKFERQMVASAAGISDVNEAGKLFGTTARRMEEAATAAERLAIADEELQEQAANATTAKEKLMLIAERFGVAIMPLLTIVHSLLDVFLSLNQMLGGMFIPVMMTLIGIWWLSTAATKRATAAKLADMQAAIVQAQFTAYKTAGLVTDTAATETNTLATNTGIIAKVRDRVTTLAQTVQTRISTIALGAWNAIKRVGNVLANQGILLTLRNIALAPVLLLWSGLKRVAAWLGFGAKVAETNATIANTAAEGASIPVKIASTSATTAAVGPTLAFGAAILMVGAGVFLAAFGISLVVAAFAELNPLQIIGAVVAIYMFTSAMIALATAMVAAGPVAIPGMIAFGQAFLMIGAGVLMAGIGMLFFAVALGVVLLLLLVFTPLLIILVPVMMLLSIAMIALGAAIIFLGMTMPFMILVAFGLGILSVSMMGLAVATVVLGVGMMLLAIGATTMVGLIIPLAEGMAMLAESLLTVGPGFALVAAGAVLLSLAAPAMLVAAFGVAALAGAMSGLGMTLLAIGMGIALVAIALPLIVKSLSLLGTLAPQLLETSLALGALVLSFAGLAVLGLLLFPIITMVGVLTYGIMALAGALMLIKTDDLRAVGDMALGMGTISIESAVAFGKAMIDTRKTVVAIAKEPDAAKILQEVTQAFAPAARAGAGGAGGAGGDGGVGAVREAARGGARDAADGGARGERTIILQLDKKEFGRAVINIFEKEQNLNKIR